MSDYCDITTLPPETCSHCTGSSLSREEIAVADMQFDGLLSEAQIWSRMKDFNRQAESDLTIPIARPSQFYTHTTDDIYGGNDSQIEFESLELEQ